MAANNLADLLSQSEPLHSAVQTGSVESQYLCCKHTGVECPIEQLRLPESPIETLIEFRQVAQEMFRTDSVNGSKDVRLDVGDHAVHALELFESFTVPMEDHLFMIE